MSLETLELARKISRVVFDADHIPRGLEAVTVAMILSTFAGDASDEVRAQYAAELVEAFDILRHSGRIH